MNGPIRHLATSLFVAFALLIGAVTWIQVVRGPEYRDDPRNARVVAARTGRERGTIVTSDGVVVAQSQANPSDTRLWERSYPHDGLYAHVVGYSTALFGNNGLEDTRSAELVSDRDSTISGVINAILGGDLRPKGLRLTIRDDLQRAAADALGEQEGAVIAIDPATGAVLAMVSYPSFDPNTLLDLDASALGTALDEDPAQPLLNRATGETYNPGSTFKVVVSAAAMETGLAGPGTEFENVSSINLPGTTATISNAGDSFCGEGQTVTLSTAITRSCNTVFAQLGIDLGAAALVNQARAFGFNEIPAADFDIVASTIPTADDFGDDLAAVAQSAIGERDVRATPLQMALVAGAVANGGEIMEPYVVEEVFASDASIEETATPAVSKRAMSPATAEALAAMMERVVTSGTGSAAAVPGHRIAGKTGTAEAPGAAPHVWFIGFGSVDADEGTQQIAIAVVVENGGDAGENASGGSVAAPIAGEVMGVFFGG